MIRTQLFHWTIDIDPDATRSAYRKISQGGPEGCGCVYCRNFILVRDLVYDEAILGLFASLGIDPPIREVEVSQSFADDRHFYSGWLFFAGRLHNAEGDASSPVELSKDFMLQLNTERWLVPDPFLNCPIVQLNFSVEVPWLLDEPWG